MEIVFWHNVISPHQAPFVRELALMGCSITYVAAETMTPDRLKLGWSPPKLEPASLLVDPDEKLVSDMISGCSPNMIHVVAGARCTRLGDQVMKACRKYGR